MILPSRTSPDRGDTRDAARLASMLDRTDHAVRLTSGVARAEAACAHHGSVDGLASRAHMPPRSRDQRFGPGPTAFYGALADALGDQPLSLRSIVPAPGPGVPR